MLIEFISYLLFISRRHNIYRYISLLINSLLILIVSCCLLSNTFQTENLVKKSLFFKNKNKAAII